MSLTVGHIQIAEARIQGLTLRPVIGAYEMVFGLRISIHAGDRPDAAAVISGARVEIRGAGGRKESLGFARPDIPLRIRPRTSPHTASAGFTLTIQPQQITAIEALRAGGDLGFELLAAGEGGDGYEVQDRWPLKVARSDWIAQLRRAGALDILLIEVPMPAGEVPEEQRQIAAHLTRAQTHFLDGDYHACVAACRPVLEELGHRRFHSNGWAGPVFGMLVSGGRSAMTKDERWTAVLAAVGHYTHLAHHGESKGGSPSFSRADAQFVLSVTAALAAYCAQAQVRS